MPVILNDTEYVTTQEALTILGIRSRETWAKLAKQHGFQWTTQVGKSKRYLWKKSDVELLLEPIPAGENL